MSEEELRKHNAGAIPDGIPNTDPLDAIESARGLFKDPSYVKRRDEDIELTDRGNSRYGDRGGKIRLFKLGKKTVVDTVIDASLNDKERDERDFSVQTSIQESPITQHYDASYSKHRKDDGGYYNVWDTVAPSTTPHEDAETTVVKYDGKEEVFRHTYKNPEIAKKVASIASKRIIGQVERQLNKEVDISEIIERINQDLPDIANVNVPLEPKNDVVDYLGKSYTERAEYFRDNPDDYLQHAPKWHQHGIVTHSREFARAIKSTIPEYIKSWGLENKAENILSQQIDGVEKRQLLEVAGLLHDVGKFSSRTEEIEDGSIKGYSFTDHEEHSAEIIRNEDNVSGRLKDLGFSPTQIEYIAKCAELHFELGKVRRASKENGGFTMAFVDTPAFREAAREIIDKNPDFALEIGLLFIADGLSKSEVIALGNTDEEIEAETPILEQELAEKGLNPKLINQAKQMPVNFKVAKAYLTQWAETQ